jgi:hypothetical protein
MKKKLLHLSTALLLAGGAAEVHAQGAGTLSGDLMLNANFFQRDTSIKASDNQLYDNFLSGGEGWLSLRYSNYGFTGFLRVDVFNNSNLKNPVQAMSGFGIGAWSVSKEFKGLTITGGYIYDQIGSGILFRSYEDRGLLIDNALEGLHLKYQLTPNITIKGFTGQQKNVFERYGSIIKGFNAEGDFGISENVRLNPGVGVLNRTLDDKSFQATYQAVKALQSADQFTPKYNTYAFTGYNTLSAGDFTWYVEGAYKTKEAINDYRGKPVNKDGNIVFSTLSYARKGIAVNLTGKRTENFVMRTSTSETQPNSGMVNWQPIVAQIRPQRLIARYSPASQDLSEVAFNGNVLLSPSDNYDFNISYTHINTLDNIKLYREVYAEANIRSVQNTQIDLGVHYMHYNQDYYQFKPGVPMIKALTPFAEVMYKFNSKSSLKVQAQYMETKQDFGSWAFLALEYAIAPKWSFAVSDMYNTKPAKEGETGKHYYNVFIAHTQGAHRFSLAYVKQVEGINCTGGVCRYEPAFSGLRFNVTSSF